ncbi:MarR family winged helix-turn-helix transcriptional regulator [Acidocella sp.]|uniref:MarR family winged helix-turn-helix transcriptional regulator n=1 Tax=Acidocella sp. TaxID=50710 RepID=UPI003CFD20C1
MTDILGEIAPAGTGGHNLGMALKAKSGLNAQPAIQPPVNPLESLLGYQLRRASQAMLADLAAELADLDLRVTDMSVLLVIETNPDITQSEIGRVLAIQRANMVPLITQLERRGLVRRGATIGRAQALRLTAAGRALARDCHKRVAEHEGHYLADLSKTRRGTLLNLLRTIWDK